MFGSFTEPFNRFFRGPCTTFPLNFLSKLDELAFLCDAAKNKLMPIKTNLAEVIILTFLHQLAKRWGTDTMG